MDSSIIYRREPGSPMAPSILRESVNLEPSLMSRSIRLYLTTDNPGRRFVVHCSGNESISNHFSPQRCA